MIQEAATALVSSRVQERGAPFIHLTFLDAYTKEASDSGVKGFGDLGDYKRYFAEHYVDVGLVGTDEMLKQAVNFDVTSWVGKRRGHLNIIDEIWYGHHWPLYWYESSITDPRAIYGYKLSREAGNERFERLRRMYCPGTSCPVNGSCLALSGCPKPDRK